MKKLIRNGVFETNSSSAHSISIADNNKEFVFDSLYPDENGNIIINGEGFGRDWFKYNDAKTKASYAALSLGLHSVLIDVIKEQTGALDVGLDIEHGYIDHQSIGLIPTNKEDLRNFIFNKNSWLFGGCDESTALSMFYHVPEYKDGQEIHPKYNYELTVEGFNNTIKFFEYPDNDLIEDELYSLLAGEKLRDDGTFVEYTWGFYSKGEYYEFNSWADNYVDYDEKLIEFTKDTYQDAYKQYKEMPESKIETWHSVGYFKVREIEKQLLNQENSPYKKFVKFFIKEIGE